MSMFPHTITLFNKVKVENKSIYNKTVFNGVLFTKNEQSGRNKLDLNNSDSVAVYIPINANCGGKSYIADNEYAYNPDIRNISYTFAKGDFLGVGDIDLGDLSISEYKNKHGNLYELTGLADYRFGGLQSFVVYCK